MYGHALAIFFCDPAKFKNRNIAGFPIFSLNFAG